MDKSPALLLALLLVVLVGCQNETTDSEIRNTLSKTPQADKGNLTGTPINTPFLVTQLPAVTLDQLATVESVTESASPIPGATHSPTSTSPPSDRPLTEIRLVQIATGISRPTYLTHAGDSRLFVVEQGGRIMILESRIILSDPFLDIGDRISSVRLEQGLLSMAFHPNYPENGYFYVNYTDRNGDTTVSRFETSASDSNHAEPDSEVVLLGVAQPFANHNGGQIQFGPDGLLYIGMGDGGSGGDPQGHGQNQQSLLGTLLRIDVDGGQPYSIPADNPYALDDNRLGEIWATGLRNPWRFSFDRQTGDLFIADVGQSAWEEINFQSALSPGGQNYGWNILEGSHCFGQSNCDVSGLVSPIAEYNHIDGNCTVTGGYVYRGSQFPDMRGNYLFADYCSGIMWSLFQLPDGSWVENQLLRTDLALSSFGEDKDGELYALDQINGAIFQLQSP